jgi:hypothetical protein
MISLLWTGFFSRTVVTVLQFFPYKISHRFYFFEGYVAITINGKYSNRGIWENTYI